MVEDVFIVLVSGLAVIVLLIHMERRYIESGTGRPAGVRLTPGDKALIGCCVAGMVGLVLLLALLPAPAKAAVVADCPLGKFTDEPAQVRGHYTVILREDGKRGITKPMLDSARRIARALDAYEHEIWPEDSTMPLTVRSTDTALAAGGIQPPHPQTTERDTWKSAPRRKFR